MAVFYDEHPTTGSRMMAGAASGFIGGVLMLLFLMLYSAMVTDMGMWAPANMIATITGQPFQPDLSGQTFAGIIIHLIVTAVAGAIWGLIFAKTPRESMAVVLGILYGAVLHFLVYPMITANAMAGISDDFSGGFFIGYLLYGVGFAFYHRMIHRYTHTTHNY